MTGQGKAEAEPRAADALRDGIRRVNQAPVILACVFVVTLLTALPFSMLMRESLQSHLGNSMMADQVARAASTCNGGASSSRAGGTARQHVSDDASSDSPRCSTTSARSADGESRPSPLLWLGAAYLLLWLFLTGGILDRYARARPTRSYEFFTACGVYFVRFLRLAPLMALAYYVLFAVVHPLLLDEVFGELDAGRHRRTHGVFRAPWPVCCCSAHCSCPSTSSSTTPRCAPSSRIAAA